MGDSQTNLTYDRGVMVPFTLGIGGYVTFTGPWLACDNSSPQLADPTLADVGTDGLIAELVIALNQLVPGP